MHSIPYTVCFFLFGFELHRRGSGGTELIHNIFLLISGVAVVAVDDDMSVIA